MPKRNYVEGRLHMRIVRTLQRIEGLRFYHPPNEALRTPRAAMIMRAFGSCRAVPDLFIFGIEQQALTPICIELKQPGKKPSTEQTAWLNALASMGWIAAALDDYEAVLDVLQEHGYIDASLRGLIWEGPDDQENQP